MTDDDIATMLKKIIKEKLDIIMDVDTDFFGDYVVSVKLCFDNETISESVGYINK